MKKEENILLVWDSMGDYHRARANALRQLHTHGKVYTADMGMPDGIYDWNVHQAGGTHFTLSKLPVNQPDSMRRAFNLIAIVRRYNITSVFFGGYGGKGYLQCVVACKLFGAKTYLNAETWYKTSRIRKAILTPYYKLFFTGFLLAGKKVTAYFTNSLNVPAGKIQTPYNVIDNAHFATGNRQTKREATPTLLTVGRYVGFKNQETLIKAFGKSKMAGKWNLKLIGGGPLQEKLQATAANIPGVTVAGWQTYSGIPAEYAQASFFILPSINEGWGLVVNEAMAAGLGIAVSNLCGCQADLVTAENGFSFNPVNEDSIVKVLNEIAALPQEQIQAMGHASLQHISQGYGLNNYAAAILALIYPGESSPGLSHQ